MKTLKPLILTAAFLLVGAGCAPAPEPTPSPAPAPTDTDIEADANAGLGVSADINSAMPAPGFEGEVDEMIVVEDNGAPGTELDDIGAPAPTDADVMDSAHVITFDGKSYSASNLTIAVGDTVTWKNEGTSNFWPASNVHPSHNILPEFDADKPLAPGSEYSYTFDKAGSWPWHDHLRARLGGTITVR